MVAEEKRMNWIITADTFESLYQEAAKVMLRGYRISGTALKASSGRWFLAMEK